MNKIGMATLGALAVLVIAACLSLAALIVVGTWHALT